jgi:hypothetical protein
MKSGNTTRGRPRGLRHATCAKRATLATIATLAALAAIAWGLPAMAAMVQVPLEDSIERSDLVIRGRVLDQRCAWSDDGRWIVTLVRVQVVETLAGEPQGAEVTVRVPGGVVDGIGLGVSDMPSFAPDEESILFLQASPGGQTYAVTDHFQGKNTLVDGRVVERDLPDDEFLGQVRAIVREQRR